MRILVMMLMALSVGVLGSGCGGCGQETAPDKDGKHPKNEDERDMLAKTPAGLEIEDTVDAGSDKFDFRVVRPDGKGKGKLTVDFGSDHKLTGKVGVTNLPKDDITSEDVTPDEGKYELEWDTEEGEQYIAFVQATKGKSAYTMNFSFEPAPPPDPCTGVTCGEDEECKDGKCVEVLPAECTPKCTGGKTCVDGVCVPPCGGKCPTGQVCNRRSNTCVKDPCAGKTCPAGERCVSGVCKAPEPPKCSPACKDGATCTNGKCVGGAPPACNPACGEGEQCQGTQCVKIEVKLCGPVGAGVIQVVPNGGSSIVILNKGATQNVKVGQTGGIANVGPRFKITEVYPVRSKAVIDADAAAIGNNKGATIQREACP